MIEFKGIRSIQRLNSTLLAYISLNQVLPSETWCIFSPGEVPEVNPHHPPPQTDPRMKTLLYLASGTYQDHYDELPYDLLILVDRGIQTQVTLRGLGQNSGKIVLELGMDALDAIKLLRDLKVKIDSLVCQNEGLYGGGGDYPVLSGLVMGYALPLFQPELILVCNPDYYCNYLGNVFQKQTLWGFQKIELKEEDNGYLCPAQFSMYEQRVNREKVFRLIKNLESRTYRFHMLNVTLIKDSIWSDQKLLDHIVFPLEVLTDRRDRKLDYGLAIEFIKKQPKVCLLDYSNLYDLLALGSGLQPKKRIGMLAHSFFDNAENLRILTGRNFVEQISFPEIRFYCLTQGEFDHSKRIIEGLLEEEPLVH